MRNIFVTKKIRQSLALPCFRIGFDKQRRFDAGLFNDQPDLFHRNQRTIRLKGADQVNRFAIAASRVDYSGVHETLLLAIAGLRPVIANQHASNICVYIIIDTAHP